jgi:hypothetical protein
VVKNSWGRGVFLEVHVHASTSCSVYQQQVGYHAAT